jgi:hypothetical protein
MEVPYTCAYKDSIMKPTKHCLKKRGRKEDRNILVRNLFKACWAHVWSYHNELPSYY